MINWIADRRIGRSTGCGRLRYPLGSAGPV